MSRLLEKWMLFQQRRRLIFLAALVSLIGAALRYVVGSEIQAFPELTNVQTQIITLYAGKAAEEVERRITTPLEVATAGLPGLIGQRSISLFGLSVITLTFDDASELRQARLAVSQRLPTAELPEGVKPQLSPESTPVGEIFRYTIEGELPPDEHRLNADWVIERALKSIPGVADVVTFGGPVRDIEILLDVARMAAFNLSATGVAQAVGQNHANAGGSIISRGDEAYVVRSLGLYENTESLEAAVIGTQKGTPLRVRDVGRVRFGNRLRLGQVGRNDRDDVVEGIVLLRQGANTIETCRAIREEIASLNQRLPAGVRVAPYYDRTELIGRCSRTVLHNVVVGVLFVCIVLGLGLGLANWALILATCLTIPFALLAAFVGIRLAGYSPNLISLGAVDFGIIIETAIFAAEAVVLTIRRRETKDGRAIADAIAQVLGPALLCATLLLIAFVPIVSLQRVEGRIFRPLGITLISALIGGQLGAFVFIPLLAPFAPVGHRRPSATERALARLLEWCERVARRISRMPALGMKSGVAVALALALSCWGLGREFLPQLNEGALYVRVTAPPTISRERAVELAGTVRRKLRTVPEVVDVVTQLGRPDDGTDSNGFDNLETAVTLIAPDRWEFPNSIEKLTEKAQRALADLEGVSLNFSQPIKDNVDEAISGVKGELVVKVFGPDLRRLQESVNAIVKVLNETPGAEDVAAERVFGQPELRFTMNRDVLARHGIRVADAEDVLESALAGKLAAQIADDKGRLIDVVVKPEVENVGARGLAALPVLTPEGGKVPLGELADVRLTEGVNRIYHEAAEKRIAVKCSVRNRAVISFVEEADRKIRASLNLPQGYRLEWAGSFENASRAGRQLLEIVPLCLIAILIILFAWFGNWTDVGLLLWVVPFANLGGLAALRFAGLNLSVSAACGGIVLLGVSLLTGMMLIVSWLHLGSAWAALRAEGRGILLSSGVAIVGLIPAALSHGIGAETARPFAVVILGGLVTALAFTLLLMPALLARAEGRDQSFDGSTSKSVNP